MKPEALHHHPLVRQEFWILSTNLGGAPDPAGIRAALERGCTLGSPGCCFDLGGADSSSVSAVQRAVLERNCGGGNSRSCFLVGVLWAEGLAGPHDLVRARQLFQKACDGGDSSGCHMVGSLLINEGVPDRARSMLSKACDAGMAPACLRLADLDSTNERTWDTKACNLGSASGCLGLGIEWDNGTDGPQDKVKAREFYLKACDGGAPLGCAYYGLKLAYGQGGVQDAERARDFYRKACELGDPAGCDYFASAWYDGKGGPQDMVKAREYFRQACDLGRGDSCGSLAIQWFLGEGGPQDTRKARELSETGCRMRGSFACARWGWFLFGDRDDERARRAFVRACTPESHPSTIGCTNVGSFQLLVLHDTAAADMSFARGCDLGGAGACIRHAVQLHRSDALRAAQEASKALPKARADCEASDGETCAALVEWFGITGDVTSQADYRARAVTALRAACLKGDTGECRFLELSGFGATR
jgi:TPR repeat protein